MLQQWPSPELTDLVMRWPSRIAREGWVLHPPQNPSSLHAPCWPNWILPLFSLMSSLRIPSSQPCIAILIMLQFRLIVICLFASAGSFHVDLMLMRATRQQQGNIPVLMFVCDVSLYGSINACTCFLKIWSCFLTWTAPGLACWAGHRYVSPCMLLHWVLWIVECF
jgi:hypothetical protein